MKELKIGEEIRIRCVDYGDCDRCCFLHNGCKDIICDAEFRSDHKNVHFEIVEENQCPSDETIMRVLNCIGYEERSWIDFVKRHWGKTKEG